MSLTEPNFVIADSMQHACIPHNVYYSYSCGNNHEFGHIQCWMSLLPHFTKKSKKHRLPMLFIYFI